MYLCKCKTKGDKTMKLYSVDFRDSPTEYTWAENKRETRKNMSLYAEARGDKIIRIRN